VTVWRLWEGTWEGRVGVVVKGWMEGWIIGESRTERTGRIKVLRLWRRLVDEEG